MKGGATDRKRDKAELASLLREQVGFLDRSAQHFDAGEHSEYVRLAACIRVLLHDGGRGSSFLTQMELKQTLKYLNTAHPIDPRNQLTQQGLVLQRIAGPDNVSYHAPLDMDRPPSRKPTPKSLGFGQWWRYPVVKDEHLEVFTREALVLTVSNKEGGAHIDEDLPANWYALTRENSSAWVTLPSGYPVGSPVPASIRQIAYELRMTLATNVAGL